MTSARSPLPPHLSAAVRSAELARVVAEVLARVPRPADIPRNVGLVWPVLCPEPVALPQVATVGPWSPAVEVAEPSGASRRIRVAAVKAATVRELAWSIDRNAAVHFARELPDDGCVWALYLDAAPASVAVLCLRVARPSRSPSSPRPTPPPNPPGRPMRAPSAPSSPPTSKRRSVGG